jgi:hypothetical protein
MATVDDAEQGTREMNDQTGEVGARKVRWVD